MIHIDETPRTAHRDVIEQDALSFEQQVVAMEEEIAKSCQQVFVQYCLHPRCQNTARISSTWICLSSEATLVKQTTTYTQSSATQIFSKGSNLSQHHVKGSNLSQHHVKGSNLSQHHVKGSNLSQQAKDAMVYWQNHTEPMTSKGGVTLEYLKMWYVRCLAVVYRSFLLAPTTSRCSCRGAVAISYRVDAVLCRIDAALRCGDCVAAATV